MRSPWHHTGVRDRRGRRKTAATASEPSAGDRDNGIQVKRHRRPPRPRPLVTVEMSPRHARDVYDQPLAGIQRDPIDSEQTRPHHTGTPERRTERRPTSGHPRRHRRTRKSSRKTRSGKAGASWRKRRHRPAAARPTARPTAGPSSRTKRLRGSLYHSLVVLHFAGGMMTNRRHRLLRGTVVPRRLVPFRAVLGTHLGNQLLRAFVVRPVRGHSTPYARPTATGARFRPKWAHKKPSTCATMLP